MKNLPLHFWFILNLNYHNVTVLESDLAEVLNVYMQEIYKNNNYN